jgi:hypothetical protein
MNSLHHTFPKVWQLLGEERAREVAGLFMQDLDHWPKSGCLDDWGHQFPGFLKEHMAQDPLFYAADVAAYEWAWQQVYGSGACKTVSLESLGQITTEEALSRVQLGPVEALRIFSCAVELKPLLDWLDQPGDCPQPIPEANPCWAVIHQDDQGWVQTAWVKFCVVQLLQSVPLGRIDCDQETLCQGLALVFQQHWIQEIDPCV